MYSVTDIASRCTAQIHYAELYGANGIALQLGTTYHFIDEATDAITTVDAPTWRRWGMLFGLVDVADAQHEQDRLVQSLEHAIMRTRSLREEDAA